MMKCNVMKECQADRHCVVNADLRMAPAERLSEVARVLAPLKEGVGLLHLSFNLAYGEGGVTKYCNLPAYVTEDETERVVRLNFPADFYVRLWDGTAEKTIGGLAYRVDKRTGVVSEAVVDPSASETVTGRNRLVVNLADMDAARGLNSVAIKDSLVAQATLVEDWNLPLDFVLLDSGMCYTTDLLSVGREFSATGVLILIEAFRPTDLASVIEFEVISLTVDVDGKTVGVRFDNRPTRDPNLIFLYEDNDGVISGNDHGNLPYTNNWNRFSQEILWGHHPVVYLCTLTSERYYPASYSFTLSGDKTTVVGGVMDISYYKEVNGQLELWLERRNFVGAPGGGGHYYTESNSGPDIMKVQLGAITR